MKRQKEIKAKNLPRKTIPLALAVLLILQTVAVIFAPVEISFAPPYIKTQKASAAWLTGYNYRKQINLTGQTGAGTNYQVKLLIGESSGAAGEDFDLASHCTDFPNDFKFTDNDETTQLDY